MSDEPVGAVWDGDFPTLSDQQARQLEKTMRAFFKEKAKGSLEALGESSLTDAFVEDALEIIDYMEGSKAGAGLHDALRTSLLNKSDRINKAAQNLEVALSEIVRLQKEYHVANVDFDVVNAFEGTLNGTGLVNSAKQICGDLRIRANKMKEIFSPERGGQQRGREIFAVKRLALSWKNHFGLDPAPRGVFGEFVKLLWSHLHTDFREPSTNTIVQWLTVSR